jgi:hypothetical protein
VRKRARVRIGIIIIIILCEKRKYGLNEKQKDDYRWALHEYILLEWGNEEESTQIKRRLRVVTFDFFSVVLYLKLNDIF